MTQAFNSSEPIGVSMMTASLTPYVGLNPSFTIIEYDKELMVPLNSYTYHINLTDANAKYSADNTAKPEWKLHHDMRSSYYTSYMSPSEMKKATNLMYVDANMAKRYEINRIRDGNGERGFADGPDDVTAWSLKYVCMNASEFSEKNKCLSEDASRYGTKPSNADFNYNGGDFAAIFYTFMDTMIGNWVETTTT